VPIELLLLYGAMGGLASVLVAAVLRPWLSAVGRTDVTPGATRLPIPSWREVLEAGTHVCAGAGIGVLYWLSWGFAAIVTVPWWVRGLAFGLACSVTITLPLLIAVALRARMQPRMLAALLLEWFYTCSLAALACAWSAEAAG
jgi:hypothetical protein